MTVWCVGSINADHFYPVPRVPAPGETIAATGLRTGLGGKGANQCVAAARAGAEVRLIGCVGSDGRWAVERLASYGVDVGRVAEVDVPTGHAIITVAPDGENAIVLFAGANARQDLGRIETALADAQPGDLLLLQNETNAQEEAARIGAERGMRVVYSAAPFDAAAVRALRGVAHLLLMNEGEAAQLTPGDHAPDIDLVVTLGADGAEWRHPDGTETVSAPPVAARDTTGAGDTFAGYLAASLDRGLGIREAMHLAVAAASLKVTRPGTADAIPSAEQVARFQDANGAASPQS